MIKNKISIVLPFYYSLAWGEGGGESLSYSSSSQRGISRELLNPSLSFCLDKRNQKPSNIQRLHTRTTHAHNRLESAQKKDFLLTQACHGIVNDMSRQRTPLGANRGRGRKCFILLNGIINKQILLNGIIKMVSQTRLTRIRKI